MNDIQGTKLHTKQISQFAKQCAGTELTLNVNRETNMYQVSSYYKRTH